MPIALCSAGFLHQEHAALVGHMLLGEKEIIVSKDPTIKRSQFDFFGLPSRAVAIQAPAANIAYKIDRNFRQACITLRYQHEQQVISQGIAGAAKQAFPSPSKIKNISY